MTLAELQARLALYIDAEAKILQGQEYQIGLGTTGRRLRRADLKEVRDEIASLNAQVLAAQAAAGTAGVRRILYIR